MIGELTDHDWDLLIKRIQRGECTPFLGAGACAGSLPTGKRIARNWSEQYDYPMEDTNDLGRVSQYLALVYDAPFPRQELTELIKNSPHPNLDDKTEPHNFLATLPLPIYITSNYDNFMVRALKYQRKAPMRELCRWNKEIKNYASVFEAETVFNPTIDKPVVFHLHGHDEMPESMVLTEDDYLDFLVNTASDPKIVPARIQQALADTSLLFIGYSLEDWNFRVLYRGLVANKARSARYVSVTVQLPPPTSEEKKERQVEYLTTYFKDKGMRVYWGEATKFVEELQERWEKAQTRATNTQLQPIVKDMTETQVAQDVSSTLPPLQQRGEETITQTQDSVVSPTETETESMDKLNPIETLDIKPAQPQQPPANTTPGVMS